jgi:hypothetical protein
VTIYDTFTELRKHAGGAKLGRVAAFDPRQKPSKQGCTGHVMLCMKSLGVASVAHEVQHAAWFYYLCDLPPQHQRDLCEKMAYAVGDMTAEFYRKAYKAEIIQ